MEKITLASIKAWMDARLAETQDAEERQEIVDKAKLQAFYLGALDKYARWTKEPSCEFWAAERQEGYEYKVGHLPEWGSPCADDFSGLEEAYDRGEDEGDAYADGYARETLPQLARDAVTACIATDLELSQYPETDAIKEAKALTRQHADDLWRRYILEDGGWGENWWED